MLDEFNKEQGDNMAATIEKILISQLAERNNFLKKQDKRLSQLKAIAKRKMEGKQIQKGRIISKLQRAGILDQNGNLSDPYKLEDE